MSHASLGTAGVGFLSLWYRGSDWAWVAWLRSWVHLCGGGWVPGDLVGLGLPDPGPEACLVGGCWVCEP